MSRSWARVPLWALATENREVIDPGSLGGKVLHYSIPALEATGHPEVAATEDIKSQKLRVRGGEVLVGRLNPRKSRVAVVGPFEGMPMVASTEFVPLAPDRIDRRFLMYAMLSERTRQYLDSCVRSATRSHQRVEPETITHLFVNVPDRGEQRRIAGFLDDQVARINEIILLRRDQVEAVEHRRQASVAALVDRLFEQAPTIALRRVTGSVEQGYSPVAETRQAEAGEYGVLKTSSVRHGDFRAFENKFLNDPAEIDARYVVADGDLLITRGSGSRDLVADVAVVSGLREDSPHLLLSDLLYRVRLRDADAAFVAEVLLSPKLRGDIAATTRGAVGGTIKVRGEDILGWQIPLPPRESQVELVGCV